MPNPDEFVKFIFRTGLERDRENVVYSLGEPVYVNDFQRMFIGDGANYGGVLVGNKFLGFASFNLSTYSSGILSAYAGDLVFDKTTNNLYTLTGTNISNIESYARLTRNFTADNVTTILNQTSGISVKPLSLDGTYLRDETLGRGLEKNPQNPNEIRLGNMSYNGGLEFDANDKLKIANRSVTNERLADMPSGHIKGNLGIYGAVEDIPLQDLANVLSPILQQTTQTFGVPIGTIIDFGGSVAPDGYLLCNGQTFSASEYPELYNVIGNSWGGTQPFFKVPDLRRKTTIGSGGVTSNVIGNYVGAVGGQETNLLEKKNIPSHNHTFNGITDGGTSSLLPTGGNLKYNTSVTDDGSIGGLNEGEVGQPLNIIQPSAVVTKCIKAY
jgi:microcystin-dependent protein